MRNCWLIAKKEIAHGLNSQLAYILLLIFVITLPFPIFWNQAPSNIFVNGQTDLRMFFTFLPLYLMVFVPALAMKAWAEERQAGTIETLMTLPIDDRELVLGKFLGYFLMLCTSLLATLPVPLLVDRAGDLDWGPVIGGYLGSLCLAACCLAVSMFAGALSRHQVTAFIFGFLALAALMFMNLPELNPHSRFVNIARGVLDTRDLVYYLLATVMFLFLNVKLIEGRR